MEPHYQKLVTSIVPDLDHEHMVAVFKKLRGSVFYVEHSVIKKLKSKAYLKVSAAAVFAAAQEMEHSSVCIELNSNQVASFCQYYT